MEKMLDAIKYEGKFNFFETLDTFGIKQIKALVDAVVDTNDNDGFLIYVLQEKIHDVDACVQRLIHEEIGWRNQKKAGEHAE